MKTLLLALAVGAVAVLGYAQNNPAAPPAKLQAVADERIVYLTDGGLSHFKRFVKVRYEGNAPTEEFFNVGGKPTRLTIASSKAELLRIDVIGDKDPFGNPITSVLGEGYTFRQVGEVEIKISVGDESETLRVTVVPLHLKLGASSAEVIQSLGLPDEKRSFLVSWPDVETIDGIVYVPSAGRSIFGEHWRHKACPGLVLSIQDSKLVEITTNTRNPEERAKTERYVQESSATLKSKPNRQGAQRQVERLKTAAEKARWRDWKNTDGTAIGRARFMSMGAGKVKLKKKDGTPITISLDKLSKQDQKWIKDRAKRSPKVSGA